MWIYLILMGVTYLVYVWVKMCPRNFPPGPLYLPVIGSALSLQNKYLHLLMERWRHQYGNVVGLFLGHKPAVAVCNPVTVLEVLKQEEFQGRPDNEPLRERSFNKRLGIMFNDGPAWQIQRRFTLRHLKEFGFGKTSMEGMIVEEIEELIKEISGTTTQVTGLFNLSSVNILWGVMAGTRYSHDNPTLRYLLDSLTKVFRAGNPSGATLRAILPFLKRIAPHLVEQETVKVSHQLKAFIQNEISEHQNTLDKDNPRDFLDVYLSQLDNSDSSFTGEQLLMICMDLFSAGAESVGNSLGFALLYMVLYPDIQKKVQAEIDHHIGHTRMPSLQDKSRLPYVEAVLTEMQRCNSIAPLTVPHRATQNTMLEGYFIPKDTTVLLSLWSLLHDKEHWGDPENFRPERHMDKSGKFIKDQWLIPFGIGKRVCPGEALARNIQFLFFTSLMQVFDVTLPGGHLQPSTLALPGFTVSPQPFQVTFSLRK